MKKDTITFEEYIKQKAIAEDRNKIITNMLHDHCPITTIEKYTNVPQDRIIEIAKVNNLPLT